MADGEETTKLVIYGISIGALLFIAYLVFKDFTTRQTLLPEPIERQKRYGFMTYPSEQSEIGQIEQKLSQLEAKIDNIVKSNSVKTLEFVEKPERNVVSMSSRTSPKVVDMTNKKNRSEYFGML